MANLGFRDSQQKKREKKRGGSPGPRQKDTRVGGGTAYPLSLETRKGKRPPTKPCG